MLFAADPSRAVKRFDLALQAMEHAKKHVPDARLAVCKVIAPDEVPFWMNAADVLILTSGSEGSPNVVKEAMACDLPVVAVDVGDVREVVDGTRHCHVCEADPRVLGEALAAVIDALPVRSDGRGRTADLDLTTVARRLHRVYEEATLRRSGVLGFRARSAQAVTS